MKSLSKNSLLNYNTKFLFQQTKKIAHIVVFSVDNNNILCYIAKAIARHTIYRGGIAIELLPVKIEGLQKLTLLDFPGHIACIAFTHGCNFRCPFCHNSDLVTGIPSDDNTVTEEFWKLLDRRKGILEGVVITGGEPLLQKNIERFMEKIKQNGFKVKLDTNGSFPGKLRMVIDSGLVDYVAMDVKNSLDKYNLTTGTQADTGAVKDSISLLLTGKVPYEFRTTAVKELHTANDFTEIGKMIQGAERYYIQSYKDSEKVLTPGLSAPTQEELLSYLAAVKQYVPQSRIRGTDTNDI